MVYRRKFTKLAYYITSNRRNDMKNTNQKYEKNPFNVGIEIRELFNLSSKLPKKSKKKFLKSLGRLYALLIDKETRITSIINQWDKKGGQLSEGIKELERNIDRLEEKVGTDTKEAPEPTELTDLDRLRMKYEKEAQKECGDYPIMFELGHLIEHRGAMDIQSKTVNGKAIPNDTQYSMYFCVWFGVFLYPLIAHMTPEKLIGALDSLLYDMGVSDLIDPSCLDGYDGQAFYIVHRMKKAAFAWHRMSRANDYFGEVLKDL